MAQFLVEIYVVAIVPHGSGLDRPDHLAKQNRLPDLMCGIRGLHLDLLLLTAEDRVTGPRHGNAAVAGVPRLGEGLCPRSIREILAARGLPRLFIEGGGITVSRFLQAGGLDLLQVTIAPLIIGSGRMGISLPEVSSLADGIRPPVRYFRFGADLMVECDLRSDGG